MDGFDDSAIRDAVTPLSAARRDQLGYDQALENIILELLTDLVGRLLSRGLLPVRYFALP